MNIKPRCRYCGERVSYFGEVCADCGGEVVENDLTEITNADVRRLQDRMDES